VSATTINGVMYPDYVVALPVVSAALVIVGGVGASKLGLNRS
jgi:hypothetical protein